jgi:hypothetical protein
VRRKKQRYVKDIHSEAIGVLLGLYSSILNGFADIVCV